MRTSLLLPDDILRQAMKLSKAATKTEAVILSLETYIRLKLREDLVAAKGKLRSLISSKEALQARRKR